MAQQPSFPASNDSLMYNNNIFHKMNELIEKLNNAYTEISALREDFNTL